MNWLFLLNSDRNVEEVRPFRNIQLQRIRTIAEETRGGADRVYRSTSGDIRSDTGKVHIVLTEFLAGSTGMGGSRWVAQFPVGFPRTGCMQQSRAPPLGGNITTVFVDPGAIRLTNPARVRAMVARAVARHAEKLWADATHHVQAGRIAPPGPLDADGGFYCTPVRAMRSSIQIWLVAR